MDEIRQKIEEFQNRLTPWPVRLKQSLLSCPAILPAIGLLIGLVLQFYFNLYPLVWAAVFILCVVSYFLLKSSVNLVLIAVLICFACVGGFRLLAFNHPAANDIRNIAFDDFTFAHIKAEVISQPVVVKADDRWLFSKYSQSLPYTSFYAKVYSVKTAAGWINASGKIKFYISDEVNDVNCGDEFLTFCRLQKFSSADNPGQFNTAEYMRANGVYLSASVKSADAITILNHKKSPFSIKTKLQKLASCAIIDDSQDDNSTSLIKALLLGSRSKISPQLYNAFITTGLVHLISLSGLNVGILAGLVWWLVKKIGFLYAGRSIASFAAVIIFLLVVPANAPALRAGIMAAVFCTGFLFDRRSNAINSLAISAVLLLLVRPLDFLNAGFQLSFAATLGILLLNKPIRNFLIFPFEPFKKTFWYPPLRITAEALSIGLAAWAATAPILAWHFYRFQPLTVFWTVPAAFLVAAILILGTFQIIFAFLFPT